MRLILDFVLQVTKALTIGTAPTTIGVDVETVKRSNGVPLIPSSSLRGAWRIAACYAVEELGMTCCREKRPDRINTAHVEMKKRGASLLSVDGETLCHVCAVFGKPKLPGVVYFTDAEPLEELRPVLSIRPGVEIDDYTGRVAEGKLYFTETVEVGSIFVHSIELDVLEAKNRGLGVAEATLLLVEAARYLEPLGLGRGAVHPYLWRIRIEGSRGIQTLSELNKAAEAVMQLEEAGGDSLYTSLKEAFSAVWLPRVLILPPSIGEAR